jgi:hypothetical protein
MKKLVLSALLFAAALPAARAAETPAGAAGHWEGKLQMDPSRELDMTVDLTAGPKGGWIGTLSFPKSTAKDIPFDAIKVEGNAVELTAHAPGLAKFSATLSADQNSLNGSAANEQGEAPFQLKRNGAANVKLPPPSSPLAKAFAGAWEGAITVQGNARQVGVKLTTGPDGLAQGVLTVEQPRHTELPINTVTIQDQELRFELRSITGAFVGTLGSGGEIAGEWSQGPNKLPLTLKRVAAEAAKP